MGYEFVKDVTRADHTLTLGNCQPGWVFYAKIQEIPKRGCYVRLTRR